MRLIFSSLGLVLMLLFACNNASQNTTILLSVDNSKAITNWLKNSDSTINIVTLYGISKDSIDFWLDNADGIVITGGEDVNPALYGKADLLPKCGEMNPYRDSLEIKMIDFAFGNNVPLLGICRGLQIMNVSQGGSLIVDIPSEIGSNLHRNGGAVEHNVSIFKNSYLKKVVNVDSGLVYSNHHQAIDNLAGVFRCSAIASDGILEAIEIIDTAKFNFIMAVQWHPEAMDYDNFLSKPIAEEFLKQSKIYCVNRK